MENEYVSNLLCHFVGRSLSSDEERYNLLLKIIKQDKTLYAKDHKNGFYAKASLNYAGENNGELFTESSCVCFCDIPDTSLKIHRNKYGSFGMGFKKSFLISQGTRPVMYIPKDCMIQTFDGNDKPQHPGDFYNSIGKQINALMIILVYLNNQDSSNPLADQLDDLFCKHPKVADALKVATFPIENKLRGNEFNALCYRIMRAWSIQEAYVKIYDDTLEKSDQDNYYMEREWRCLQAVHFSLQDISTIYLPDDKFLSRFIKDVPEFRGKILVFKDLY